MRDGDLYLTKLACPTVQGQPYGLHDLFPLAPEDGLFTDWVTDWLGLLADEEQGPIAQDYQVAVHCGRVIAVHGFPVRTRPQYPYTFREPEHTRAETVRLTPHLDDAFPEDAPFIRAVHVNWDDRLPRLVYADWLDERGDPRGRLLRIDDALLDATGQATPDLQAERGKALAEVKDWFWMKLVGCPLPTNQYGWEQREW